MKEGGYYSEILQLLKELIIACENNLCYLNPVIEEDFEWVFDLRDFRITFIIWYSPFTKKYVYIDLNIEERNSSDEPRPDNCVTYWIKHEQLLVLLNLMAKSYPNIINRNLNPDGIINIVGRMKSINSGTINEWDDIK